MPAEQVVLFVAVAALALALVVVLVAPRLRGGSHGDLRVRTPRDGRDRAPTSNEVHAGTEKPQPAPLAVLPPPLPPPPPPATMVCPTCRRQYAAGLRFCPYDARVLTSDVQVAGAVPGERVARDANANPGKICPSCARRYDAVAMVCGRDGSALVSVN